MPQSSYQYAIGRVKALENNMLDTVKLRKLAASEPEDFFKVLAETGYGSGSFADENLEEMIKRELKEARRLVWEITPEPEITSLFLLHIDAHNLKVLFKARLLDEPAGELLEDGGVFPLETLEKSVNERNYTLLPNPLKQCLEDLEKVLLRHVSPQAISTAVDTAVFRYIASIMNDNSSSYAKAYFSVMADLTNVRSLIRARILTWDVDTFVSLIIPGGYISKNDLINAFAVPNEQLALYLNKGPYADKIASAIEEYVSKGSASVLEKRMDALLMQLARTQRTDVNSIGPIIGYLLGKEAEARAVSVIYAAKRQAAEPELPELYM